MTIRHVDVAIIGGGPGGLALAQGLKKNGIDVAVFERDRARIDYVQGFRLRLRQRGLDALKANLPDHLFQVFLDTLGRAPTENRTLDDQFNRIEQPSSGSGEPEDTHVEKSVSRITLRQILLDGLDDILQVGIAFERYETQDEGTVIARFSDGSAIHANLLVGADGAGSLVRRQLLPELKSIDTGVRRLAGKMTLAAAARHGISPLLLDFNTNIRPREGHGLMVTSHRVPLDAHEKHGLIGQDDATHRGIDGFHFNNTTSYVWWNTAYELDELGPDSLLETLTGSELLEVLLSRIGHWDERILRLIRHTDPSTVALLKVRSSTPGAVWETGPVTLLGDSIHAMTYFRALGGNTALYDGGLLVPQLVAARNGKPLRQATRDYEDAMRDHGYEAVRSSLVAMQRNVAAGRISRPIAAE
jgi:2-polyprenyl-6-methoxyphenol hydroxylase-like FAD-dependent oxidoreductase